MTQASKRVPLIVGGLQLGTLIVFLFGVSFLSILLVFAVFFPNPTGFQQKVFITVLALAAGGVGAMLPGYLEIRYKGVVRAGGAVALAVGVYAYEPAITKATATLTEPTTSAEPVALAFLKSVDQGDIEDAWKQLDPSVIGQAIDNYQSWKRVYESYRKPLGEVTKRDLVGINSFTSPAGLPIGIYRQLVYRTKFANTNGCRGEQVILRASPSEKWSIYSYLISPAAVEC